MSQRLIDVIPPPRTARFEEEPGLHGSSGLWFYGNIRLLHARLAHVQATLGSIYQSPKELDQIEGEAEELVLSSRILVCGVHSPAHQRAAVVPLRWGAPRILVFSGGFHHHLGESLKEEPFRVARLWRYEFDAQTDLVVSRRAPTKKPTFAQLNPTVDRLITGIAGKTWPGLSSPFDSLTPVLSAT